MHASLVVDLALVLGVAAITSPIAKRLGQPTVLGYLAAGLVVGPYIPIPLFADHERVESLAELGVVLVMFAVGLELRIAKLVRVLPTAGLTGVVQVGFLMWCGFALARAVGWTPVQGLFLGACIAISSTMVVTRALGDGTDAATREHVLGVLVVQDVLAIVLIAAMTGVATGGSVKPEELTADLLELAVVLVVMIVLGLVIVPRLVRAVASLASDEVLTVVAIGVCFVLAAVAAGLGYSVALGAFVSGVLVAESGLGHKVEQLAGSMRDVFAAIFFVSIGMTVDPREAYAQLPLALLVTAVVIGAQLAIVSLAGLVSGIGVRRSVTAGLALGQIGEFAFILASIGVTAGVVDPSLRALLVTVAVLTAFTTPIAIKSADRVVGLVDRAMPGGMRRVLALHEQWIAGLREPTGDRGPIRRSVRALALDAALAFGLAVGAARLMPTAVPFLVARLGLDRSMAQLVFLGGALLATVPFLVFAVRTTSVLARAILASRAEQSGEYSMARVRVLRALLLLGLTALVGFPAAIVVAASVADSRAIVLVFVAIVVLVIAAIRSARAVDAEVKSAAQRIAAALTRDSDPDLAHIERHEPTPAGALPDLGPLERVALTEGSPARGRTLADLDLRAKTGATVVAIHRDGGASALPNGRERLDPGDVLVLVGTEDALRDARTLLEGEPAPA